VRQSSAIFLEIKRKLSLSRRGRNEAVSSGRKH
jgi:hypothetical protein